MPAKRKPIDPSNVLRQVLANEQLLDSLDYLPGSGLAKRLQEQGVPAFGIDFDLSGSSLSPVIAPLVEFCLEHRTFALKTGHAQSDSVEHCLVLPVDHPRLSGILQQILSS